MSSPWLDPPQCQTVDTTRVYSERYRYDLSGGLTELRHVANAGSYTRVWNMSAGNNRLNSMRSGPATFTYSYDPSGNLIRENQDRHYVWDHQNNMRAFGIMPQGAPPSVNAQYLYDSEGQRVKKLVRRGAQIRVTVYVDDIFEHHWLTMPANAAENSVIHTSDETTRHTLTRAGAAFPGDGGAAVQYHLSDHLGSSTVVADDAGNWTNREDFYPLGATSFGGFALKRFRFTGKERDEESGLSYHGRRYLAPWLGRWTSPDPLGTADSLNLYSYVDGNLVNSVDPSGESIFKKDITSKKKRNRFTVNAGWVDMTHVTEYADNMIEIHNSLEKNRKGEVKLLSTVPGVVGESEKVERTYKYDYSKEKDFDIQKAALEVLYRVAYQEEVDQGSGLLSSVRRRWTAFNWEDMTSDMVGGVVGLEMIQLQKQDPTMSTAAAKKQAMQDVLKKLGTVKTKDALEIFAADAVRTERGRSIRTPLKTATQPRSATAKKVSKRYPGVKTYDLWNRAAAIATGKRPKGAEKKK